MGLFCKLLDIVFYVLMIDIRDNITSYTYVAVGCSLDRLVCEKIWFICPLFKMLRILKNNILLQKERVSRILFLSVCYTFHTLLRSNPFPIPFLSVFAIYPFPILLRSHPFPILARVLSSGNFVP